jgi:hypothetical protein
MSLTQPSICDMAALATECVTRAGTALHYIEQYRTQGGAGNLEQARHHAVDMAAMGSELGAALRALAALERQLADSPPAGPVVPTQAMPRA